MKRSPFHTSLLLLLAVSLFGMGASLFCKPAITASAASAHRKTVVEINAPETLDRPNTKYVLTKDVYAENTAFFIQASDITLDLAGHTVTYNTVPSNRPTCGVNVAANCQNISIENGSIIQGEGQSKGSPAIKHAGMQGGSHFNFHDLNIRVKGLESPGITGGFSDSKIHHNYIEVHSDTNVMYGDGSEGIVVENSQGGLDVYDNIIVKPHRGIRLESVGSSGGGSDKFDGRLSKVHGNLIQHERRLHGNKAPYGILLSGSRLVDVYDNQIGSDNGRGIMIELGSYENVIHENVVDVRYSQVVRNGMYVENNVYGIRNRYRSGDNRIFGNRIFVNNTAGGASVGIYVGSDNRDPNMDGIEIYDNDIFVEGGSSMWLSSGATGIVLDWVDNIQITSNRIRSSAINVYNRKDNKNVLVDDNTFVVPSAGKSGAAVPEHQNSFRGRNRTETESADTTPPRQPRKLSVEKHLDAYVLRWEAAKRDKDVAGYLIERNGKKLLTSPRAVTFFVDLNSGTGRQTSYSVRAIDFSGNISKAAQSQPLH